MAKGTATALAEQLLAERARAQKAETERNEWEARAVRAEEERDEWARVALNHRETGDRLRDQRDRAVEALLPFAEVWGQMVKHDNVFEPVTNQPPYRAVWYAVKDQQLGRDRPDASTTDPERAPQEGSSGSSSSDTEDR